MSSNTNIFPPGTELIEASDGKGKLLYVPRPSPDPNQPLNWSTRRKVVCFVILQLYTIICYVVLCAPVPCWQEFNSDLGWSYDDLTNGYATQVVSSAVGPMIFVPLALRIGTRPVFILTGLLMFGMTVWQAKMSNVWEWYVTNFIIGGPGSLNQALVPVVITDMFYVHQRATTNGIFVLAQLIGNYLGPVATGYMVDSGGWPWAFWSCAIFTGTVTLIMILFLEETKWHLPEHLQQVGAGNQAETDLRTGDNDNGDKKETPSSQALSHTVSVPQAESNEAETPVVLDSSIPMKTFWERYSLVTLGGNVPRGMDQLRSLYQPYQLFVTFPGLLFCAIQWAIAIVALAIVTVTQGVLFPLPPYEFSPIGIGNMNIPPAIGSLIGFVFGGPVVDWFILKVARRRHGIYEPETRLWIFWIPAFVMIAGLLMYGLTIAQGMPWIINAVGAALVGFGVAGVMDIAMTYAQDSYAHIVAEAFIPITFIRNIVTAGMTFGIPAWMDGMGVYNMFVLLTCVTTAFLLLAVPLIIYGRTLRAKLAGRYEIFIKKQI